MLFKRFFLTVLLSYSFSQPLFAGLKNLNMDKAILILKEENLELKIAKFNENIKFYELEVAKGSSYGKVDLTVQAMRSNDAGNVFGFKLQNREASFGDFGLSEFDMTGQTNPLIVEPKVLNYPKARNYYQSKLTFRLQQPKHPL